MYRIILSLGLVAALTAEIPLRYDQCRIWIDSSQDLVEIASLGVDFEGSRYKQGVFIDLIINEEEHQQLIDRGFHIEILQEDMAAYYASQLSVESVREFGLGSMGGYYTYAEALASMDSLAAQYPNIVTQRDSIGETIEGRAIWTFKM